MKIFVISDSHFNHGNIIKYCNRPFETIDEMNNTMIKNWNSVVSNDDKVFHLGDVGLGGREKTEAIIKSLKGRKVLIRGNHDNFTDSAYLNMGFEEVYKYPIIWNNFIMMSHRPLELSETTPFFNLYGHIHTDERYQDTKTSKCVSVERINYTPLLIYDTIRKEYYNL